MNYNQSGGVTLDDDGMLLEEHHDITELYELWNQDPQKENSEAFLKKIINQYIRKNHFGSKVDERFNRGSEDLQKYRKIMMDKLQKKISGAATTRQQTQLFRTRCYKNKHQREVNHTVLDILNRIFPRKEWIHHNNIFSLDEFHVHVYPDRRNEIYILAARTDLKDRPGFTVRTDSNEHNSTIYLRTRDALKIRVGNTSNRLRKIFGNINRELLRLGMQELDSSEMDSIHTMIGIHTNLLSIDKEVLRFDDQRLMRIYDGTECDEEELEKPDTVPLLAAAAHLPEVEDMRPIQRVETPVHVEDIHPVQPVAAAAPLVQEETAEQVEASALNPETSEWKPTQASALNPETSEWKPTQTSALSAETSAWKPKQTSTLSAETSAWRPATGQHDGYVPDQQPLMDGHVYHQAEVYPSTVVDPAYHNHQAQMEHHVGMHDPAGPVQLSMVDHSGNLMPSYHNGQMVQPPDQRRRGQAPLFLYNQSGGKNKHLGRVSLQKLDKEHIPVAILQINDMVDHFKSKQLNPVASQAYEKLVIYRNKLNIYYTQCNHTQLMRTYNTHVRKNIETILNHGD